MIKKPINQNDILDLNLLNSFNFDFIFGNSPINHIHKNLNKTIFDKNKLLNLNSLKEEIISIKDCDLKKNASKIVFGAGNIESDIMIIGDKPGKVEDETGEPMAGDTGALLDKMLSAININRKDIYITNVVNYCPPDDRKLELSEIYRYTEFLKKHITIINPKLIILMGNTAKEALIGSNKKISFERGSWKEIIIKDKSYNLIITFHPSYLLRKPEQKKFSWSDLKSIKKKIIELKII